MDGEKLVIIAGIVMAIAALSMGGEDTTEGGEDDQDNGDNGTEIGKQTIKLSVEGQGQARLVLDGVPQDWTESGYQLKVEKGTEIGIDVNPAMDWKFARYEGKQPPYTA